MVHILVRHKVKDFNKWKKFFDGHRIVRKATGSKGGLLFGNAENPNEIFILLEWDDLKKAKSFVHSDNLKETMMQAGVVDKPDIYFLEEVENVEV